VITVWQPIETAPKDGTRILVWGGVKEAPLSHAYGPNTSVCLVSYREGDCSMNPAFYVEDECYYLVEVCHPTHWQHLPKSPEEDAKKPKWVGAKIY